MKEVNGRITLEVSDLLKATIYGKHKVVDDWPYGRDNRCIMVFSIEKKQPGMERFVKQSTFNDRTNKPKKATYARAVQIIEVDGFIGRVELAKHFPMISVYMENGKYNNVSFHEDEAKPLFDYFFLGTEK
jgi:hypothetical protein